jgi:hypothetical protein
VIAHQQGSRKRAAINRNQFYYSLVNNLHSRINTTIASNTSSKENAYSDKNKTEFLELISQVILTLNSSAALQ